MSGQTSFEAFVASVETGTPPAGIGLALLALWHEARGDWAQAHDLAQSARGQEGDWVHAYLHRKEGDEMNAAYWYGRARKPSATGDLQAEWAEIARALIKA